MTVSFRKLVMHEDLNPAGRLFGGRMLAWADEACAIYAMCQLRTRNVVTLKFSESLFLQPVKLGDFLEFCCDVKAFGRTSITVACTVQTKDLTEEDTRRDVFSCAVIFVAIDENGHSAPHGRTDVR